MNTLLYIDAENIAYSEFKRYYDTNTVSGNVTGKVYGNRNVLGDSVVDYLRLGFEYIDTSVISDTKNVADMKIVTDCIFDVLQTFGPTGTEVVLITRDCDFLPLVYRMLGIGVRVTVPFAGTASTNTVSTTIISNRLEEIGFDPMSSNDWMRPLPELVQEALMMNSYDAAVDHYCNRKRVRYIHGVAAKDPIIASKLEEIEPNAFSAKTVFKVLRENNVSYNDLLSYIKLYTNKFFGKSFAPNQAMLMLHKLAS